MPKETSLSAQLKRLQVPQTSLLNSVADRRRVSFLYDPKEAANLDSEAVYCLAMNGLEQLKLIDAETFESFESTLFNSTTITYERAIQTKQTNEKLNMEIGRFLLHLSPYFMLKPAHKAFEWLVFRYQIHLYNLKEMLMCLLPYHETNYFVRALQMIDFDKTSQSTNSDIQLWSWLLENQKNGVQLASTSLATHLYSDLSFFNFLAEYLQECLEKFTSIKKKSALDDEDEELEEETLGSQSERQQKIWMNSLNFCLSFLTKILLQSVKQLSQSNEKPSKKGSKLQESYFAQLLPVLFEGFKSNVLPYKQSSYLICSYLFEQFNFNPETTNKALYALSRGLSTFRIERMILEDDENSDSDKIYDSESLDCIKSAFLAICLIVQSQYKEELIVTTLTNQLDHITANTNLLISKNFLKKLFKNFNEPAQVKLLLSTIDELNESYLIDRFLKCLLTRLLGDLIERDKVKSSEINLDLDLNDDEQELEANGSKNNKYFTFIIELVNLLNLNRLPNLVEHLVNYLFQLLIKELNGQSSSGDESSISMPNLLVEYHLCELIFKFECKYPQQFDKCLSKLLSEDTPSSLIENQKQRSYFLNTISCKFSSFKCKSAFKYQQIAADKQEDAKELNLLLSLNHTQEVIRASGLSYILSQLNSSESVKNKANIDKDFIRTQLELRFLNESSPLVVKEMLKFNTKLLTFFDIKNLLENEKLLLKLFTIDVFTIKVVLSDESEEMNEYFVKQNEEWIDTRQTAIFLMFDDLYKLYQNDEEMEDLFFNTFLVVSSRLFELNAAYLLNKLKSTAFYNHLQVETNVDLSSGLNASLSTTPNKKRFYSSSTSSISIKKLTTSSFTQQEQANTNGHANESSVLFDELNDLFETYLQISVKHMLSTSKKLDTKQVKPPKCFDQLIEEIHERKSGNKMISLLDIFIFEISNRVSTQSLFHTNASYYLNICATILIDLIGRITFIKIKKSKSLSDVDLNEKQSTENGSSKRVTDFSNYYHVIAKQSFKNPSLLFNLYQTLFKSLAIQVSNFVNKNSKLEINSILNRIYQYLCTISGEHSYANLILVKLMQSCCFNSHASPALTPTKLSATNGLSSSNTNNIGSFFQFAFKFIIYIDDESDSEILLKDLNPLGLTQLRTIQLFNTHLDELLIDNKRYDYSMLNALVLILTWCTTNKNKQIRVESLGLLQSISASSQVTENGGFVWKSYLKKLLKHKQEIEIDGGDYVRSKCLNKIFNNTDLVLQNNQIIEIISHFLNQTINGANSKFLNSKVSSPQVQNNMLLFQYFNDLNSKLILNEFKHCLLDLLKNLKDDIKLKFTEPILNILFTCLNEPYQGDQEVGLVELDKLNLKLIDLIVNNFLLTSKSTSFFNDAKNEKYFDYLIGYLNTNTGTKNTKEKMSYAVPHLKQSFVNKLATSSDNNGTFFLELNESMQLDLLNCCFKMLLVSEDDGNTLNTETIRNCFTSFNLTSKHYLSLLNEKANLKSKETKESIFSQINTMKEMKKLMMSNKNGDINKEEPINWKSLKLIVELIQSSLVKNDARMDVDEVEEVDENKISIYESFIYLIPQLFLILETTENKLTSNSLSDSKPKDENDEYDEEEMLLNLEIMSVNSLSSIYRLNKANNKDKLDSAKFNIELLMQILQTKHHEDNNEKQIMSKSTRCLNVQEHVLLLLSEIAAIFPDKVLEHVLIMFVFVGNKLARKDDSYSFQIITKVIETILPSIVNSVSRQENKIEEQKTDNDANKNNRLIKTVNVIQRHQKELPYVSSLVCKILQSFVVSLPHIPAHRKTIIFNQLLQIIGLNDYLWITIVQSIDYYLVQSNDLLDFTNSLEELTSKQQQLLANDETNEETIKIVACKNEKKIRDTLKTCIQSMISLHIQFEPTDIIKSSIYLIAFLNKYFTSLFDKAAKVAQHSKSQQPSKQIYSHLACQLDNYNLLQMKYLAYNLLTFVSDLLVSEELMTKLVVLYEAKSSFRNKDNSDPQADLYSQLFQNLLEKILLLILKLSQIFATFEQHISSLKSTNNATLIFVEDLKKFHKAILNKSYDLMEKTINLLDSRQFIYVVKSLLKHDLFQIRRRVLALLNTKLRKFEPNEQETTLLISMIDDLLSSIKLKPDENNPSEKYNPVEVEINNQSILFSIKLLCKRIGEENPLAFVKVIKYLSENLIDKSLYIKQQNDSNLSIQNSNLLSSVLLCIGEVCLKLKSNALIYLNKIMSFSLEIVDIVAQKLSEGHDFNLNEVDNDLINDFNDLSVKDSKISLQIAFKNNELLILSCVTCLLKIVQNMANFLSPYLPKLFHTSCFLSYLVAKNDESNDNSDATRQQQAANSSNNSQIEMKLTQFRSTLATLIPLRLLAPILNDQSASIGINSKSEKSSKSKKTSGKVYYMKIKQVEYYMQIARLAIQHANQEDLIANIRTLRSMFMNLFEMRHNFDSSNSSSLMALSKKSSTKLDTYATKELCKYENYVIGAFCEMTYKLSEDLFRPIFFKIYEWSTVNNPPKDHQILFYRATLKLSDKLKSLFVLFAPQFVQNAADTLNLLNSSKTNEKYFETSSNEKEKLLLYSIVDTLSNVFLNDNQRTFVNKERFNLLLDPIVDQIENEIEYDDYRKYISEHLGPCIANLASCCVHDDTLCRKFNYQILLKTKHNSVQVRLATLDVLDMFSKRVGDIYNSYLSETVPFLAELMEDPVEEVEERVQSLISELEDMLGESLQSHFV